jgi:hypothetical protein
MRLLVKLEIRDGAGELVGTAVVTATSAVGYRFGGHRWADFSEVVPPGNDVLESVLNDELGTLRVGDTVNVRDQPELAHVLSEAFRHQRMIPKVVDVKSQNGRWTVAHYVTDTEPGSSGSP